MSFWRRFWIGGGGALLPLLVTLLAVDLANLIDHYRDYSFGTYVGTALRYTILFVLGGIVAALNADELQPIKLVQLGIAAPALVASYVNAQPAKAPPSQVVTSVHSSSLSLINPFTAAHAMERPSHGVTIQVAGGFLSDVLQSAIRPLPNLDKTNSKAVLPSQDRVEIQRAIEEARQSAAQAAAAADKAAADAARLKQESSPNAISTVQQSASDAAAASQKASSDLKALQELSKSK